MLEDRHYMRRNPFRTGWWSTTVLLIIANAVAFIVQMVLRSSMPQAENYLALSVDGLRQGYVWQLLSFQFMHGNFLHLLLNCWAIFLFGREVEQALGRKSFLTLYLASGVVGGMLQVAFSTVLSQILHKSVFETAQVVGASAGASGLIAAFAMLYPEKPLVLLPLFFVSMQAKYLLIFEGAVAVLGMAIAAGVVKGTGTQVAHAAHLGGMITGILFIKYAIHWQFPQLNRTKKPRVQRLVRVPAQSSAFWGQKKSAVVEDLPADEFLSKEVDPILDKISAHGIQSLTDRERRILQAARDKMAKR